MAREDVLIELLNKDTEHYPNILLLKKLLLSTHHGWFRINGLPPDKNYTLADYLFDDERLIIDFTRMSGQTRKKFINWFLMPHGRDAHMAFLSGVATNDYRGYTAEVGLSWWGRITNLWYYKKKSYHWHLAPIEFSFNYQLTGLEICQGEHGLLIGFNQFSTEGNGIKYHEENDNQVEPLRNTKRVLLTDEMVDKLISINLEVQDYRSIIKNPHPFSINVVSHNQRMKAMHEYRQTQRLLTINSWYTHLWRWLKSWFEKQDNAIEMEEIRYGNKDYQSLFSENKVHLFKRYHNGEILVTEKRPELDSMVYCGGGAKIFAHVGAFKAFEEAHIKPTKYAGSSAGAIMAILCYLGYSSDEILKFFQGFRQDNLIFYDIDRSGLSDTRAMKAALDYMVIKKVNEIIQKYELDKTVEGRRFLANSVFKYGKITFESLHLFKSRYPDCGLGEQLIVTATNVERRETRYFSYATTPKMEISEAGKISASIPVVYKPTKLDGEIHNDGGILSNFPTEVFKGDLSTLLESEHGNCLSMVAFQFDNGCERSLLDKLVDRVYRENFLWNWIYGLLTGVKDPVSGWERDRLKLLQHSNQVVLIPVDNVSSTQFDIDLRAQNILVDNGYQAAKKYITTRYQMKESGAINEEYMHSTFSSIEELLHFCCYRGHADWFERIALEARAQGVSQQQIQSLRKQYFSHPNAEDEVVENQESTVHSPLFSAKLSAILEKQWMVINMQLFEAIYPIFHKLPYTFIRNPQEVKLFKLARHSLSLNNPLAVLRYLGEIKGEMHVLLSIFIQILSRYQMGRVEEVCLKLKQFRAILQNNELLLNPAFYGNWDLLPRQADRVLRVLGNNQWPAAYELCSSLKQGEEPLQTIIRRNSEFQEGLDDDYTDNWCIERDRSSFSI